MTAILATAKRELRQQALLIAVMLLYIAAGFATAQWFGLQQKYSLALYNLVFLRGLFGALWALLLGYLIWTMAVTRPARLFRHLRGEMFGRYLTAKNIFAVLPVVLLLAPFVSTFTSLKLMIPDLHPFSWDAALARWDGALHGGVQPWRLLQPLIGLPFATSAMNIFYYLWFVLLYGGLIWWIFDLRDRARRDRFLLSFVLVWILLGTVGGLAFSSAGPCFYDRLVAGENPYGELMNYLRQANQTSPVWVLATQEKLWAEYVTGQRVLAAGISAMPSLHIAIAWLMTLAGCRANRWLGPALGLYCLVLMISSVHLGWHYAIDGYVAILTTSAIWWGIGKTKRSRTIGSQP
jgi:hypothetical protein